MSRFAWTLAQILSLLLCLTACGSSRPLPSVDAISGDIDLPDDVSSTADCPAPAKIGKLPKAWIGGANDDGTGFVDWRSGAVTPTIIMGPQGGQHVYVSVRAANLWPKKIRMGVEMRDALTDEVVKPGRIEITSSLKADCEWMTYTGMTAFVKEPCKISDRKLKVHLDVSDLYGVKATDDAVITPHWEGYCAPNP